MAKTVIVNVYRSDTDNGHPYSEVKRILRRDKNFPHAPYYVKYDGREFNVYPSRKAYYKGRYDLFIYDKNRRK